MRTSARQENDDVVGLACRLIRRPAPRRTTTRANERKNESRRTTPRCESARLRRSPARRRRVCARSSTFVQMMPLNVRCRRRRCRCRCRYSLARLPHVAAINVKTKSRSSIKQQNNVYSAIAINVQQRFSAPRLSRFLDVVAAENFGVWLRANGADYEGEKKSGCDDKKARWRIHLALRRQLEATISIGLLVDVIEATEQSKWRRSPATHNDAAARGGLNLERAFAF